ncbi:RNA polymerase sigma factor [Lentibacillus cibarius]|uniref:RNA polymerase sigma factor n=1 Tax=Lentibacillus cibarius TaxID=2583219 RepID=A0A549YEG7_9BACI|nr:RNA polymerase sigma factor [Lentibacillus cibarius]TMN21368.1 RNA polymerase sigma factor [Lentibacillus cibarius]TRM10247.1 RNA polymerase sigma factor [Lentibacillus cibarius]
MKKQIFTELFAQYQLPLYRYLLQMSRDEDVAEELLQETFYRAMISLKVKNMIQAKAWLFKVARNLYIDRTRKSKSEKQMVERIQAEQLHTSEWGNPDEHLERMTKRDRIEKVFHHLPERMRTILYLREIQEFTYKEVATAMNLTESQVKTTLHRARKKFRYYDQLLKGRDTE